MKLDVVFSPHFCHPRTENYTSSWSEITRGVGGRRLVRLRHQNKNTLRSTYFADQTIRNEKECEIYQELDTLAQF